MAASLDARARERLAERGFGMLSPERGRLLLSAALDRPEPRLVITAIEPARQRTPHERRDGRGGLELLRSEVSRTLRLRDAASVPLDVPLRDLGLDSLMAVELRNALAHRLGRALPVTLPLDGSLERLAPLLFSDPNTGPASPRETSEVVACEVLRALEAPRLRLFCFPDAGGDASMFLPFTRLDAAGIEVHAIACRRAPQSSPPDAAREYRRVVADYVRARADVPYALFGHSLGSSLAWRICAELAPSGFPPALFVPSAMGPGQLRELASSSIDAIIDRFGERSAARDSAALRDGIRHDMELWSALWADAGHAEAGAEPPPSPARAALPIAAFAGNRDRLASEDDVRRWQQHTDGDFSLTVLPGDHAFIYDDDAVELLLDELTKALLAALSPQPATRARRPVRRSMTSFG